MSELTDNELIIIYRKESNENKKNKIFKDILFRKLKSRNSWHDNIKKHVNSEMYKFAFCKYMDQDDLYQKILRNFIKAIENKYNLEKNYCFSTYAWNLIQNTVNREIQNYKTKKRNHEMTSQIIKFDEPFNDNSNYASVISDSDLGMVKTLNRELSFEKKYFYKTLIDFLKSNLKQVEIENLDLKNDLNDFIHKKSDLTLKDISEKYSLDIKTIVNYKEITKENFEKQIYCELMNLIEYGAKNENSIIKKFKVSKNQIVKIKKKVNADLEKKLSTIGIKVEEIFS